jgi:hypothetical protein
MEPDMHGAGWRKASYSMANGNCVEAISTSTHIAVRDSVNAGAIIILYPTRAWQVFIDGVKAGSSDALRPRPGSTRWK